MIRTCTSVQLISQVINGQVISLYNGEAAESISNCFWQEIDFTSLYAYSLLNLQEILID